MGLIYLVSILAFWGVLIVKAEDPYKNFTFHVTYGWVSPLGTPQRAILINGKFPGPRIDVVTNDNVVVHVFNYLDEPFLLTWNGIKMRKNSWQDGVLGTNCPIPPKKNFTYKFQTKDQIGSYTYFPSIGMQRANGGFGAFNIEQRSVISIPYDKPAGNVSLLIGDWFNQSHKTLRHLLDTSQPLPLPDAILINGQRGLNITGDPGKTYMFRVSNIGFSTHVNFRIQDHLLRPIEVEGSHVLQTPVCSIDLYVGQSMSVLVTLDQPSNASYHIVLSSTFPNIMGLNVTGVLHYNTSTSRATQPVGPIPEAPKDDVISAMDRARSIRWNLTANAARPNPQGSFNYSKIPRTRTIILENSAPIITANKSYAVNNISYVNPETPLKLADYFNITDVFDLSFPQNASSSAAEHGTKVLNVSLHEYVEIVFQNNEPTLQTWHLDGYDFFVVGMGEGVWSVWNSPKEYNNIDAFTRHTVQVFPYSWSAIYVSMDNQGMWNLRSAMWERQYLGQQFYIKVYNPELTNRTEFGIPSNALLCGKAANQTIPKPII